MKTKNYIILSGSALAAVFMATSLGALIKNKQVSKKPLLTIPDVEEKEIT